jgi:uncharacterized SAM-dependent methyltransferase
VITVTVLVTERQLADEFVASFRARRLAEKFFYWFPLSVRAWLELCSDSEYRNYVRSRSLIARSAGELAAFFEPGPLEVLSLGSGQGDKDLILLEALRSRGVDARYLPFDTSQALLELAAAGASGAGFPTSGFKADFTSAGDVRAVGPAPDGPARLTMVIGNTLGAVDPLAFARDLGALMRAGDLLLVDGELFGGPDTMAGYDNPINRRFAWAPLHSIGIGEEDGELVFESADDERLPGLHLIRKHFRADRPLAAMTGGEAFRLDAGGRLAMNHSYKYSRDSFLRILADAGLVVCWDGTSDDGRFLMALAGPG